MSFLDGVILGLVQGLTEFLPVSSSGHLVLAKTYLGLDTPGAVMESLLHLGTLVSVVWFYRADLSRVVSQFLSGHLQWLFGRRKGSQLWADPSIRLGYLLILGTLPAAAFGLAFKSAIESLFSSALETGIELMINAFILWAAAACSQRAGGRSVDRITPADALWIGAGQAFAILPAISRSGATVAAALWRGLEREAAVRFSFLLSIPAIAGALVLEAKDIAGASGELTSGLIAGTVAAAVSGYLAIAVFTRVVARGRLSWFAWYCLLLGIWVTATQWSR